MEMIVEGLKINYKIEGEGPTVVVLQGWGTSCDIYTSIANHLKSKYQVILFDLPGFGASEEPKEAWSVGDFLDFTIKFLEKLEIKEASFMGHSYGGRMIIKMMSRKNLPFTVSKLVLIDAAGIKPKQSLKAKYKIKTYKCIKKIAELSLVKKLFPIAIEEWKSKQGSADYRNASPVMRQCLVKAVNEDLTELLPNIGVDTLLFWGELDTATPISDGELMEKMIPNAGLVKVAGAGHYSFLDNPVLFERVMKSYFKI